MAQRKDRRPFLEHANNAQDLLTKGPVIDSQIPLVVDLDGTLLRSDTLYESFASAIFRHPLRTLASFVTLFSSGIAPFKRQIARLGGLDVGHQPVRSDVLEYLQQEHRNSRPLHLATAADQLIAAPMAERFQIFESVQGSTGTLNLKGRVKAAHLVERFPDGFAYAGDAEADLEVWRHAKSAVIVAHDAKLGERVRAMSVPVEREFRAPSPTVRQWLRAMRVHQWAKNALVLVPVVLGWYRLTVDGALATIVAMLLLCALASLTYFLNDISDLAADRRHWSKRLRPFASGTIPVRDGLLLAGAGIPLVLIAGFLVAPAVAGCLIIYLCVTLGYSFGLKQVPILDTFIIASLFTLRIVLGMAAASLDPSSWLLTFSMFFFFSLAVAKRHTELLRAAHGSARGRIEGRGYHVEDKDLMLALGIAASVASVLIIVIYLVDDIFARAIYAHPAWLWVVPCVLFLWISRVWLLAHRGLMRDDPVVFALKDRVSIGLGVIIVAAYLAAVV